MLNPDNLIPAEQKDSSIIERIKFESEIPDFDNEEYDYFNDKDFKKYMQALEKEVRCSIEYRNLISYCRENMNMNKCSFFENVNNVDTFKIRIELHHTPFGLYDICKIVFIKRCYYREPIDVESVAEEVIMLHYYGLVGLIPLSETVHQMVHNNYIFVPVQYIMGRYQEFVELYREFILQEEGLMETYERIVEYSQYFDPQVNLRLLERKYIHYDFSGAYNLPKLEDIHLAISKTVNRLKSKTNIPEYIGEDNNKQLRCPIGIIEY